MQNGRAFRRLTSQPNFKACKIFSEDLVAVNMMKKSVKLVKPTYVGMTILDLSKLFMFAFHYKKIVPQYGEKAKLLMTDTDSLVYRLETTDVYDDMATDQEAYDTSDYPRDHPLYNRRNAKVLGKMKDEQAGRIIKQFVGLRPKMYSILEANNKEIKKAKGINKCSTAKMRHKSYVEALLNEQSSTVSMTQIRSLNHDLYTMEVTKTALSPYDDKRYVLDDGVSTLAYGHYKIKQTTT